MRGQLLVTPDDDLDVLINVHGGRNRSLAPSFQHLGFIQPVDPPETQDRRLLRNLYRDLSDYFDPDRCRRLSTDANGTRCLANHFKESHGDPFGGEYSFTPREKLYQVGTSVRIEFSTGDWSIESVSSFEHIDRKAGLDLDASPRRSSERRVEDTSWQLMQDLRLDWTAGRRLGLSLGLFLLHADLDATNFVTGGRGLLGQTFDETTDYLGVYGLAHFDLSSLFSVDLGLRLNVERKDFFIEAQNLRFVNGALQIVGGPGEGILLADAESLDVVPTGDVVFEYHPTGDVDFYLKFVRGYKGRHFNAGETNDATPVNPADPEFVNSFELGYDARLFSGLVSWRAATFLYLYENQQVYQLRNGAAARPINELINAQDARVFGFETDVRIDWRGWNLFAAFGWTHAEYSDFIRIEETLSLDANSGQITTDISIRNFSGNRMVLAPEFSFSGWTSYEWALGGAGILEPRFDFSFKDSVFTTPSNSPELGDDSRWLFDVSLRYSVPDERISISAWVRNLTDEIYRTTVQDSGTFRAAVAVGDPRTYGLTTTLLF